MEVRSSSSLREQRMLSERTFSSLISGVYNKASVFRCNLFGFRWTNARIVFPPLIWYGNKENRIRSSGSWCGSDYRDR